MDPPSSGSRHTRTWSLEMGDCIGMESCIDLENDVEGVKTARRSCCGGGGEYRRQGLKTVREKREFPPPIPLLAQTENLPSHMPWVLKRHYSDDGRLIIWEEKVRHHEYIRAERSNGRLTLQLIPLDNQVPSDDDDDDDDNEEECSDDIVVQAPVVHGNDGKDEEEMVAAAVAAVAVTGGVGGGVKCYNSYSGVRSNLCMYGMEVPAIRPVHI